MQEAPFTIYNASAGSGKTYTLAKTYLKIVLSEPGSYRRILALTFTNKAVTEMKERILGYLHEFSRTADLENASSMFLEIMGDLGMDRETLTLQSKATLKDILHNYAHFDIATIDKFTYRLIRTFAKDLRLPQNFEVVLDNNLLLDEGIARLLDKAGTDTELTQILIDYSLSKIDEDKSWDITFDLRKIGKLLFDEAHAPHLWNLQDKGLDDFLRLREHLLTKIHGAESLAVTKAKEVLGIIARSGLEPTDFPRMTLPNHFGRIKSGEFDTTRLYANQLESNLREGRLVKSGVSTPGPAFEQEILSAYLHIKELLYDRAFYKNIHGNLVPLTVLNSLRQEVANLQIEREQLSISRFNTLIAQEIKNQPAPFIYERLGEKYRHYFIDEFQDTSELQWTNLIPLIENALAAEKGTLFLVGDAKQAIYRWRGGRAELLLDLERPPQNPFVIDPKTIDLPANYRSLQEIVAFNNDFFSTINPLLTNTVYLDLFEKGSRQRPKAIGGGVVRLDFVRGDGQPLDGLYGERVLTVITEVLEKGYAFGDICILTRKKRHGILLADFLISHKIPIVSSETLLLKSSPEVIFLINLLRYAVFPDDRATVFDILYFLNPDGRAGHSFFQSHEASLPHFLSTNYQWNLDRFRSMSAYDGLEYSIRQFGLVNESDAYITFLLDAVLETEQKEGSSIPSFLDYWESKRDTLAITAPETMDAVGMMTIHKAKGLEFPIVIFPYADTPIYDERDPKLWLPVDPKDFCGFPEVLVNKRKEVVQYGPTARHLFEEEEQKLELDAFNLLYVALTRAIAGLFVITEDKPLPKSGTPNSYAQLFRFFLERRNLWSEARTLYTFGTLENRVTTEGTGPQQKTIPYGYSHKDNPRLALLARSGVLWLSGRGEALDQGNLFHHAMSLIGTEADIDPAMLELERHGQATAEEITDLGRSIRKLVAHPKLSSFYGGNITVWNERDIILANSEILRPDRIVLQGRRATLIDYKTGAPNPRHKTQLATYANALEDMGYTVDHKIIIYIKDTITPEFIETCTEK